MVVGVIFFAVGVEQSRTPGGLVIQVPLSLGGDVIADMGRLGRVGLSISASGM